MSRGTKLVLVILALLLVILVASYSDEISKKLDIDLKDVKENKKLNNNPVLPVSNFRSVLHK